MNKEQVKEIANKLLSVNNGIYWDNDEERWYFDSEETLDSVMKLAEYVDKSA